MLKLLKQYKFIILTLVVCLIGIGSFSYESKHSEEFLLETKQSKETTTLNSEEALGIQEVSVEESIPMEEMTKAPQMVPVYICGEVLNPDVYYVQEGTLIKEVIHKAGGFTEDANRTYLNLASPVQAHGKIVVPKQGEEIDKNLDSYDNKESAIFQEATPNTESLQGDAKYININTASVEELMELDGIGEKKAKAIKAHREENGGFKSISELTEVDGIGDKTFENIKDLIIVQ